MNKKKKAAYNKPSVEILAMEAEGNLLSTSMRAVNGTSGRNTFSNSGTTAVFSRR